MSDPDRAFAEKLARLRRLIELPPSPPPPPRRPPSPPGRIRLARDLPAMVPGTGREAPSGGADDDPLPVEAVVPGTVEANEYGRYFVSESVLPPGHRHGRWPLGLSLELTRAAARWLSLPAPVETGDLRRAVFVDVETTGLAGGTGTLPFLVGLGGFEDGSFVIRQYLMRGPEEERPVLSAVARLVSAEHAPRAMVVSFNGKAFDLPLLETRYILNRLRSPFPADHLDLLFASRRVWGRRLDSCRLASLESEVLGVKRWQDVPGALVPQLYYDYLRSGDGRCLSPVFEHNLLDVLSLVSLTGRLGQLCREPLTALEDAPEDLLSLGRCFERAARFRRLLAEGGAEQLEGLPDPDEACLACYREALGAGLAGNSAEVARYQVSLHEKRRGRRAQAAREWETLAAEATDRGLRFLALVELAKHHEHHTRNFVRAQEYVAAALQLASSAAQREALEKRLARLLRKQRPAAGIKPGHPA